MSSDKDLVDAVCSGEHAAFAVLVERYERAVRSVAVAILRDTELAHDIAQDAFVIAFEKLSTLTNRAAFGSWILKIAGRCAYRVAREKSRERVAAYVQEPTMETRNGRLDEKLETLLQAVARLPRQERLVVMLKYFNNEPVDAVARITGRTVGTVTKQLTRARRRLKTWLGDRFDDC